MDFIVLCSVWQAWPANGIMYLFPDIAFPEFCTTVTDFLISLWRTIGVSPVTRWAGSEGRQDSRSGREGIKLLPFNVAIALPFQGREPAPGTCI